eukprot:1626980-Amphidinium_carterae.2
MAATSRKRKAPSSLLQPGMRTVEELQHWPIDVIKALTMEGDDPLLLRLQRHVAHGLTLSSDYSGLDMPREALEMGIKALVHLHPNTKHARDEAVLQVLRTCDKGVLQTEVQVCMAKVLQEDRCHFIDILDRLPAHAREYIKASQPPSGASLHVRSEANQCLAEWLMTNRANLFDVQASSWCAIHERSIVQ